MKEIKKIFLVYLSEKFQRGCFDIFREVETKTLDLKPERGIDRYKVKLPGAPIAINQSGSTVKSIDKKETNQDNMEDCLFCKWKNEKEKL